MLLGRKPPFCPQEARVQAGADDGRWARQPRCSPTPASRTAAGGPGRRADLSCVL